MKLKAEEIEFMLEVLDLPRWLRRRLEYLKTKNEEEINNEEADTLRDLCGERLQSHGFDKDYKTTNEGRKLENLIDKLFIS